MNIGDTNLPAYTLPLTAIQYQKPNEDLTEYEKRKDNGFWFTQMARWSCLNFFNGNMPVFYNGGSSTTNLRCGDEILENYANYYGRQQNKTFAYTETLNEKETIQAVYVPDQKIRQIVDSMLGNTIKMIQPIKDSISAKLLSEDSIKGRDQLRRKLEIKQAVDKLIGEVNGVKFAPSGVEQIEEGEDIDDIINEFKEKEQLRFIKLGQSIYFRNRLSKKFEDSGFDEIVGNISNFVVEVNNGQSEIRLYPSYNSIIDTRATDDYLSDAMLGGGVQFLTAAEVFTKWGNELSEDEREHINRMTEKQYSNWLECYNYYNSGCPNLTWWIQETGKVACATVYWIGKKNLPYRKKKTGYGTDKLQFLDDDKMYHVYDDNGKQIMDSGKAVMKKGNDIKTEGIWAVHQCTLIGNYCSVGKGYHPLQIRSNLNKQKPILPTITFVHRLKMGYYRSVVSRLRHYAEERGRLALKIQELTGRDMGKVHVLFASKLGLAENETQEVFKDFKTMGFTIINDTGEASDVDSKLTADMLDFSLQPTIVSYIQLWKEQAIEMENVASTSQIAMGQQTRTIGKGVQEQSISQSTLGQLSMYDGLKEHWRQVMQYALNCEKMLRAGKTSMIQTSENDAYLLNINKNETYQDLGLYIEESESIEGQERQVLIDGLFALNQHGGSAEAMEGLLATTRMVRINSAREGEEYLEKLIGKKKREDALKVQAQMQGEQQHEAGLVQMNQTFQVGLQQLKEENSNYRAELTATLSAVSKMQASMEATTAQMLALLNKFEPQSPLAQAQQAAPTTPEE